MRIYVRPFTKEPLVCSSYVFLDPIFLLTYKLIQDLFLSHSKIFVFMFGSKDSIKDNQWGSPIKIIH